MTTLMPEGRSAGSPKISIVTPSLNQAHFLEHAICSVLDQQYPNLEYIIIDGGSTDGSVEIIRKYQQHLHYWCSEPDQGHYAAINKGFEHASGDIYAWLNSDDMYCKDAFQSVAGVFQAFPEVQWVSTLQRRFWDSGGACIHEQSIPGYSRDAFLDGLYITEEGFRLGFIQQESTFWSSRLWQQSGGIDARLDLAGDFDLWCRFFRHADLFGVAAPLAGFRWHGNNRSKDTARYIGQAKTCLDGLRADLGWNGPGAFLQAWNFLQPYPGLLRVLNLARRHLLKNYRAVNLHPPSNGSWSKVSVRF